MKKLLLPGILAVLALFLPLKSQAVPLDVPYQIFVSTTNAQKIVLSTTTFPSASAAVNANVANYQWCIEKAVHSSASAANFTFGWATSAQATPNVDLFVGTSAGVPFTFAGNYRDPYCAPVGQTVLTINSSVATSSISVQGYLWKGWNP